MLKTGLLFVSLMHTGAIFFVYFLLGAVVAQVDEGTSCPSGHVQWYTKCLGESPCERSIRLRRVSLLNES